MSTEISALPEECLVHILRLTSPEDVLRSAAVSKLFFSVAVSSELWKNFLPSDYHQIISLSPLRFNCLKDLFVRLYRSHLLIDDNKISVNLNQPNWKKCYMLGSRSLSITWGDTPDYWTWISVPESRFPENAKLKSVCWLDIKGQIPAKWLSPNITYGAYFVFKLANMRYTGFEYLPVKVSVLELDEGGQHPLATNTVYLKPPDGLDADQEGPEDLPLPVERGDGWMEMEMGTYQIGSADAVCERVFLVMALRQTEILNWKHGLLIQGIELRPLD